MKFLALILFLFSFTTYAQMRCEELFAEPSKGKLENFKPTPEEVYSGLENLDFLRQIEKFRRLPPHKQVEAAREFLDKNQIEYQDYGRWTSKWLMPKYYHEIRILPKGDSELNRLAKSIFDLYGGNLIYSPGLLAEFGANGVYDKSNIYISDDMVLTGSPDLTFFHEVRHLVMTYKESSGKASIVNGLMKKSNLRKWPWGKHSKSFYKNRMNLQEAETWHQAFVYELTYLRQLNQDGKLTHAELKKVFEKISRKNPRDVFEDVLDLVGFEIQEFQNQAPEFKFDSSLGQIKFYKTGLFYSFSHIISKGFVEKFLKENNIQMDLDSSSVATREGQEWAHKIILAYLNDLKQDLLEKQSYFEDNFTRLTEIQKQSEQLQTQKQSISELNNIILKLGQKIEP